MTSIRITDPNKLAPGDVATFHVTGQMRDTSQFTGQVRKSTLDGLWYVGPVWVYDTSRPAWNPEVFFDYAYREVPLPIWEWSVIANIQTADNKFYDRAILTPNPNSGSESVWTVFDSEGLRNTYKPADILDFTLPELL